MAPASEGKAIRHRRSCMRAEDKERGCQPPGSLTAPPLPRTLVAPCMASDPAKKILIIEDERDILQLVKLYLEKEGFRTVTASSGAEGLNSAKQSKPDLIVLDLMLPEIDGLEVCKRLRSAPETAIDRKSVV